MNPSLSMLFIKKLNEVCGLDSCNLIYSLFLSLDSKQDSMKGIHYQSLNNLPLIIDAGILIFTDTKTNVSKTSYAYIKIKEEEKNLFKILTESKDFLRIEDMKIGDDKRDAALAIISSIYFNSFTTPVQFFLPHSSICSGQWEFWDKINYLELMKKIHQKETIKLLSEKLLKSNVWKTKFKADDFPEIVKRRLLKEKLLEKKLNPEAMIKAMIIRMGELAAPSINYEIIDFSIRSFFTYLGVKQESCLYTP